MPGPFDITTAPSPTPNRGLGGMLSMLGGDGGGMGDKAKNSPDKLSPMVPTAAGGFYQPVDTTGRSSLLQAMMQRSRSGREALPIDPPVPPAPTPTPAPTTSPTPAAPTQPGSQFQFLSRLFANRGS
jgi:hypothetical protein